MSACRTAPYSTRSRRGKEAGFILLLLLLTLSLSACAKPIRSPKDIDSALRIPKSAMEMAPTTNARRTSITATYPRRFLKWDYPPGIDAVFTVEVTKTLPARWQVLASTTNRSVEIWLTNRQEYYRVGARMP